MAKNHHNGMLSIHYFDCNNEFVNPSIIKTRELPLGLHYPAPTATKSPWCQVQWNFRSIQLPEKHSISNSAATSHMWELRT